MQGVMKKLALERLSIDQNKAEEPESKFSPSMWAKVDLTRPTCSTRRGQGGVFMRSEALLNPVIHRTSTHTGSRSKAVRAGHQEASKTSKSFDRRPDLLWSADALFVGKDLVLEPYSAAILKLS